MTKDKPSQAQQLDKELPSATGWRYAGRFAPPAVQGCEAELAAAFWRILSRRAAMRACAAVTACGAGGGGVEVLMVSDFGAISG